MKFVNLDKFKTQTQVQLDGKKYTVKGMTVAMFIEEQDVNLDEMSEREKFAHYVQRLSKTTSIPEDVLKEQELPVLIALMQVAQGVDPEEPKDAGDEGNQ